MEQRNHLIIFCLLLFVSVSCRRSAGDEIAVVPTLVPTAISSADPSNAEGGASVQIPLAEFEDKSWGVRFSHPRYWTGHPVQKNLVRFAPDPVTVEELGWEPVPLMLVSTFDEASLGLDGSVNFSDPEAVLTRYLDEGLAGPRDVVIEDVVAVEVNGFSAARARFVVRPSAGESDEDERALATLTETTLVLFNDQFVLFTASAAEADWETAAPLFALWLETLALFEPESILE